MNDSALQRLAESLQCALEQVATVLSRLKKWEEGLLMLALATLSKVIVNLGFTQVYSRYWSKVRRHALQNKGTLADAQDLMQESVVKLYKAAQKGKLVPEQTKLDAYFTTIFKNTWIDLRKKDKNDPLNPVYKASSSTDIPEQQEEDNDTQLRNQQLFDALSRLTTKQKTILTYLYFEEKKPAEIHELMKHEHSSRQVTYNAILAAKEALLEVIRKHPNRYNRLN